MGLKVIAARVSLEWIDAWQVDPDQLEVALHHLTDLEQRVPEGAGEMTDFNFHSPAMAVGAAIIALCDAFDVERFTRIDEIRAEVP